MKSIILSLMTMLSVAARANTPEVQIIAKNPIECRDMNFENVLMISNAIAQVVPLQDRLDIALQFAPGDCENGEFISKHHKVDAYLMGNFGQEMLEIKTNANNYSLTFIRLNYSELKSVEKYKLRFYQHGIWQTKVWTFKMKITKTSDSKIQIELE